MLKSKPKFGLWGVIVSSSLREKYSLSMTSTAGASGQPQLTLEPYHMQRKVTNIQQWLTACNTFVTIYSEKAAGDAPRLMTEIL